MKIKLWQSEYEFDQQDAKLIFPLLLLVLALIFTQVNKVALLGGATAYYLLYFFLKPAFSGLKEAFARLRFRCPYCKSRELILQGYQGYHSDEHYAYYLCNHCHETAVLVGDRLLKSKAIPK